MEGVAANPESESRRVVAARARAAERVARQRGMLRPLGWAMIVAVTLGAFNGKPSAGLHGTALGITTSLAVFDASLGFAIRDSFPRRAHVVQAALISVMGAAGVALAALQTQGTTDLAAGAAVWMAVVRLPLLAGVALGAVVAAALDLASGLTGSSSTAVVAATLLCALLGLVAYFIRQARAGQDRTEELLAQLEDARDEQARTAAIAERGRIASELHDVLAHALSGAAIQLQGARMLAEREHAEPRVRAAIDRASELVREGLASARQAVGALRGEELPGVAQLDALIASFRDDMQVDATLTIEGAARPLPADASLALYRGAQEALTNVARYAPGARTTVVLRYDDRGRTSVRIDDTVAAGAPGGGGLAGVGGGRGLAGMRERVERAGGSMHAGPTESGWRVELDVPA